LFNLIEYRREAKWLADRITWFGLLDEATLMNKDGSLQSSFKLIGYDSDSISTETISIYSDKLNKIISEYGSGWALYFDVQKTQANEYIGGNFQAPLAKLIDEERREFFTNEQIFKQQYHLTVIYLPESDINLNTKNKLQNFRIKAKRQETIAYFKRKISKLKAALTAIFKQVDLLTNNSLLRYLHSTVSVKKYNIKMPAIPAYLDFILCDCEVAPGITNKLGNKFFKIATIRHFPDSTTLNMLERLTKLNFEFRWTTRWLCLSKQDAKKLLHSKARAWMSKRLSFFDIISKILGINNKAEKKTALTEFDTEIHEAKESLELNKLSFGYCTITVMVTDTEESKCQEKIDSVINCIQDMGFGCIEEDLHAREAWLGSIPGHIYANIRYPVITGANLVHLVPITSKWLGQKTNCHFKQSFADPNPLMLTTTQDRIPFYLSNHYKDIGHTLIIGPTGSGKSTLLVTLALQFLRYQGSQVFYLDKGYSCASATYLLQGQHYSFNKQDNNIRLQPLGYGIDDIDWMLGWLEMIVARAIAVTPNQRHYLEKALHALSHYPKKYRTISTFLTLLQDDKLRKILMPFSQVGIYGHIFDANTAIKLESNFCCFELNELFDYDKFIIESALMCIFKIIEDKINGNPSLLIIDEGWLLLQNDYFISKLDTWLRTLRKNEVSVLFASTNLTEVVTSGIGDIIVESCKTKIMLPNSDGANPTVNNLYKKIGLSDKEINLIVKASPKQDYVYISPLGVKVFQLNLGKLAKAVICNAGEKALASINKLKATGVANSDLVESWLKHKKIN